jgi:hypothetical protein
MLKVIMVAGKKKRLINSKEPVAEFAKTGIAFAGGKLARHWRCVGLLEYVCFKCKVLVLN